MSKVCWNVENVSCRNRSLGLTTKARNCKVAGQEKEPGVTSHALGSAKSVRGWTLTLPSELHVGSWSSKWIPKYLKHDCKGQNMSSQSFFYIIEKLLKLKCLKWARITHLDNWNTSYDQKKGRESNWQFDSRPLKVGNRPNFVTCKHHATYHWKVLNEGYKFSLDLIAIGGLHAKLCAPKVVKVPIVGISGLPLGNLETKNHLDVAPVESCRVYYKGEGGGFPQVQIVVSLVNPKLPMTRLSTKSAPTMH